MGRESVHGVKSVKAFLEYLHEICMQTTKELL